MLLRRWEVDRATWLTAVLLLAVTIAAWIGVIQQATAMDVGGGMADEMTSMAPGGGLAGLGAYVVAWVVMIAAMMLPAATPMVLLYRTVARGQSAGPPPLAATWVFVLGYLAVWAAFGVMVYVASVAVAGALAMDMTLAALAPYGVALVLIAAGVYQWTPLKEVCLRVCQSPLGFLMTHWRPGYGGALRMGVEHGLYCSGCCWALMAVLVAAGAMGLAWVTLLALVIFAEKLLPGGQGAARLVGGALVVLGLTVAARPEIAMLLRGQGM
jgi:predicted metal-binding membrane protein